MKAGKREQGRGKRAGAPGGRRCAGLTLLEVILAVTLMGMLFGVVFGVIGTVDGIQLRNQRTLAAYEVAHRLVLAHLDDDTAMPSRSVPIDYGRFKFMYDLLQEPVVMELNRTQRASDAAPQGLDRYKMVTISVYAADAVGDYFRPGERVAELSRVYDPFAPRNPDSAVRYFGDINKLMNRIGNLVNDKGGGQRK